MIVYTYYDSDPDSPKDQARFIRLWAESWRKHGWKPLLLTERMAEEHPNYKPNLGEVANAVLAIRHYGKPGLLVQSNVINFGFRQKDVPCLGTNFGPGCVKISQTTISRGKYKRAKMRYLHTQTQLKKFHGWNADEVVEAVHFGHVG
jgi:hypothetical protein